MFLAPRQSVVLQGHDEEIPFFNRRESILGFTISFMLLCWICSSLRLYTRFFILRVPGWDDLFIVLMLLSTTVGSVDLCILTDYGMGEHFSNLSVREKQDFLRIFYVGSAVFPMSLAFIKIALLFQYLRIYEAGSRYRTPCKVFIVVTALWGLVYCALSWVPCYPVAAFWDWTIKATARYGFTSEDAGEFLRVYVSHAVTNVILDLIVFLLAMPLYFLPQVQPKSRVGLLGLFALGVAVNICSIWRLTHIIHVYRTQDPIKDVTWYGAGPVVMACLEVDVASICAALPVFWPVLIRKLDKIHVTHEVTVTHESRRASSEMGDVELRTTTSEQNLMPRRFSRVGEWVPWIGEQLGGLGSKTVVESNVPHEGSLEKRSKEENGKRMGSLDRDEAQKWSEQ